MKIGGMGAGNIGGTDRVDPVEWRADMGFNLALKQGMGRRLAFKLLR